MCLWLLTLVCDAAMPELTLSEKGDAYLFTTQEEDCAALSAPANSKYWDAMGKCNACASVSGCGFCRSTMTCTLGDGAGPAGSIPCYDWIIEPEECPVNPRCEAATDCKACAGAAPCVWCASDATCMSVEESYGSTCQAMVSEPPCPEVVVPSNVTIGFTCAFLEKMFRC